MAPPQILTESPLESLGKTFQKKYPWGILLMKGQQAIKLHNLSCLPVNSASTFIA
jgi:hypothetical protein